MGYVCEVCGKPLTGRLRKFCPECETNQYKSTRLKEKDKIKNTIGYAEGLNARANTKQCRTCRFWHKEYMLCDYLSIVGVPRGCEPSPNCTKYEKGKREAIKKPFSFQDGDGVNYQSSKNDIQ